GPHQRGGVDLRRGPVFMKWSPQSRFMRREKERFGRAPGTPVFTLLFSPLAVASCAGVILAHYLESTAVAHRSATGTRRYTQAHSLCTRYPCTRCLALDALNYTVGQYYTPLARCW
ncbi:unnamed protein product, partial [Ectocarpus sp. 13 AM-2016]